MPGVKAMFLRSMDKSLAVCVIRRKIYSSGSQQKGLSVGSVHAAEELSCRCQIDKSEIWHMVCGKCWKTVSGGVVDGDEEHPYYRSGCQYLTPKRKLCLEPWSDT